MVYDDSMQRVHEYIAEGLKVLQTTSAFRENYAVHVFKAVQDGDGIRKPLFEANIVGIAILGMYSKRYGQLGIRRAIHRAREIDGNNHPLLTPETLETAMSVLEVDRFTLLVYQIQHGRHHCAKKVLSQDRRLLML